MFPEFPIQAKTSADIRRGHNGRCSSAMSMIIKLNKRANHGVSSYLSFEKVVAHSFKGIPCLCELYTSRDFVLVCDTPYEHDAKRRISCY